MLYWWTAAGYCWFSLLLLGSTFAAVCSLLKLPLQQESTQWLQQWPLGILLHDGKSSYNSGWVSCWIIHLPTVSLIQILLWKMNQPSLGFFPEAPLTNFVQNSQADPAQQYDGDRQDLLTFGWRQGKTVLQACPKKSSGWLCQKPHQTYGKWNCWQGAGLDGRSISSLWTAC